MAKFNLKYNPVSATPVACAIAGATEIETGDAVTLVAGLIQKADNTSSNVGIAQEPSKQGEETPINVLNDSSMVFEGNTASAFAANARGKDVDLTATDNKIDLSGSTKGVFHILAASNTGVVGSRENILFRLNKPL